MHRELSSLGEMSNFFWNNNNTTSDDHSHGNTEYNANSTVNKNNTTTHNTTNNNYPSYPQSFYGPPAAMFPGQYNSNVPIQYHPQFAVQLGQSGTSAHQGQQGEQVQHGAQRPPIVTPITIPPPLENGNNTEKKIKLSEKKGEVKGERNGQGKEIVNIGLLLYC